MLKRMKLFPKTFLYTLLLFCLISLITHGAIYYFYPKFYLDSVQKDLDEKVEVICNTLSEADASGACYALTLFAKQNGVNVITETGGKKETYRGMETGFELTPGSGEVFKLGDVKEVESLLVRDKKLTLGSGAEMSLQIVKSTQPVREATNINLFLLPFTLGIAVVCSVIFAYFYSRKITDPVLEMLEVTRAMKNLEQDACFRVNTGDEIGLLAAQINEVYAKLRLTIDSLDKEKTRIAELEKSKVEFLRSASHELKTPVAGLRILLENMRYNIGKYKDRDTYLEAAIHTVDELTAMLQEILDSSRIQGQAGEAPVEMLAVKEEIEAVFESYKMQAGAKKLRVELNIDEAFYLEMNREFFRRVWSNLISNAVRYTEEKGMVLIQNEGSELSIRNTCKPLTEEQISHVFEAFYRPDFARSTGDGGSGLGLYIVKEILEANHFAYAFEPWENGICFTMQPLKN